MCEIQHELNTKAINEWNNKQDFIKKIMYGEHKKYLELYFFKKYGKTFSKRQTQKMWDNFTEIIHTIFNGNYELVLKNIVLTSYGFNLK
jgi:hypothetical protein